jgi:hypothetical protein
LFSSTGFFALYFLRQTHSNFSKQLNHVHWEKKIESSMVRKLKDIKESDSKRQLGSVNRIFKFVLV